MLKDHEVRVVAELKELQIRLKALNAFINGPERGRKFLHLPELEQELLVQQEAVMRQLATILATRIGIFVANEE